MDQKKLDKLLNRKRYKQVKAMDRQQMCDFVVNIYAEGFKDGADSSVPDTKTIPESKLKEALLHIKGIGETKADLILQEIKPLIDIAKG